jgi:hypothetical protein
MIQEILVIVSVAGAVFYIGRHVYVHHFSSKKKCDGCVINKVYQAKIDSQNR